MDADWQMRLEAARLASEMVPGDLMVPRPDIGPLGMKGVWLTHYWFLLSVLKGEADEGVPAISTNPTPSADSARRSSES